MKKNNYISPEIISRYPLAFYYLLFLISRKMFSINIMLGSLKTNSVWGKKNKTNSICPEHFVFHLYVFNSIFKEGIHILSTMIEF